MDAIVSELNTEFAKLKLKLTDTEVIRRISECLDHQYICFSYQDVLDKLFSKFSPIPTGKGLYLLEGQYEINTNERWKEFKDKWKLITYTPDIIDARFNKHDFSSNKHIPLYSGKASDNLHSRVIQHIFALKKDNTTFLATTYALRLLQHIQYKDGDKVFNLKFKVKYIKVDIEKELLPILENAVRERVGCIIGKNS